MRAAFALALLQAACGADVAAGEGADAADGDNFRWPHHGSGDIVLDTRIRDWVLIPIFIIMVFFTMLREIGGRLMNAMPKGDITVAQQQVGLASARTFRQTRPSPPSAISSQCNLLHSVASVQYARATLQLPSAVRGRSSARLE
jgi:hypothetical protein